MPTTSSPTFAGFSPEGLRFLRDLAKRNEREWFTPRKHVYETELLEPLRTLLADATAAMRKAKIPLGADPKRSTFRIHRDVRFSPDKRPYKTNLGAYFSRDGSRDAPGGLYLHIQPKESFIAIAFFQIDKPLLQRWRADMATAPKHFEAVLRALERNGLRLSKPEDALKRMPRGFEGCADTAIAEYFRFPSFVVREALSDQEIANPGLTDRMVSLAKRAKPLLEYGWSLVETS